VEKYVSFRDATDDNIELRIHFACWIPKFTNTHTEYVILICFPTGTLISRNAPMLRYVYISSILTTITLYYFQ
jgi:hypothetical protein